MNKTNLLLCSAVFFHHGDLIPAYEFTHYPCAIDQIYIEGLNENNLYMKSDNLYFYEDEQIFILNPFYTNFELFSKEDNEKIGELHIRWKTDDCEVSTVTTAPEKNYSGIVAPTTITVEQNEPVNVLQDVYAYEEGTDISYTLQSEVVDTSVPGSYISTVSTVINDETIEKDIIIEVIDEDNNTNEETIAIDAEAWTPTLVFTVLLVILFLICIK